MSLLLAWVVFPLILTVLAGGCGLLVAALCGRRIPGPLAPVTGFALIVVVGQFLTLADATAELVAPACVAMAVAGILLALPLGRLEGWAAIAALSVFAVYAAPIVLSGEATFAGYIRLDDTATWMALTDRVMEHGRDLGGLAPSSYEATLAFNLADGYPVGVFLPLGAGRALVGQDVAWLIQPYMAWLAAILALAVWSLARPLVASAPLRALVAFIAAQSALLFGYYLWGGVKELAGAALIASVAAMVASVAAAGFAPGAIVGLALICAALVGVLSAGGVLWLVPALGLAGALALGRLPARRAARRAAARAALLAGVAAALSVPVLATGGLLPPTSSPLTDADARGNLLGPLEPAQVAGIWPAGDFRVDPAELAPTYVLIAVALIAAVAGLALAWRARAWGLLAYVATALGAGLLIYLIGSPWVEGKALATASPAVPLAAALTGAWLFGSGRRVEGAVLLAAIGGGILWSNALAYRDVNLAPRDQLVELQEIGERIAGEGPVLMTEYQPYGVRHFLREADPEGVSELRRRQVPLAAGGTVRKGEAADTDALEPGGLFVYRSLVLRRSPAQSRPPAPYRLTWRGQHYQVWQRPTALPADLDLGRIGLGGEVQPVGTPDCEQVEALASRAAAGARLAAAVRPPAVVVPLSRAEYPQRWSTPATRAFPVPDGVGTIAAPVALQRRGRYEIWLGGGVRPGVELAIDGEPAGTVRHRLQNGGQYVLLGAMTLEPGRHLVTVELGGADLHPGSGGPGGAVGPLVLSRADAADAEIVRVAPEAARRLCGRRWDWIELEAASG